MGRPGLEPGAQLQSDPLQCSEARLTSRNGQMSDIAPSNDARRLNSMRKVLSGYAAQSVTVCQSKGACVVAGIGVTRLNEWRERYPDLQQRLSDAREHARLKALQGIKAAGERDWRAWSEWLKLTNPAEYRGRGAKIEVSAFASAMPVITVEDQRRIQEARLKLLQGEINITQ
jgi:hypothetical protein